MEDAGIGFTYETWSYEYEEPLRKQKARCLECDSTSLVRTGYYTPDFFLDNGVIIEVKGRFTAADRRKMIAVAEDYPDETFVMLFQRNNKIHKNSKTTYADWCEANGFDYAIEEVKEDWLK